KKFNGYIHYTAAPVPTAPTTPVPTAHPTVPVTPNPTVPVTPNPTPSPTTASPTPNPTPSPTPTPCPEGDVSIEVDILTDNYPSETSWTLTNTCTGEQVAVSPSYSTQGTSFLHQLGCLPAVEYEFSIADTWGDGICCSYGSGSYTIRSDGAQVASGGDFGSSETKTFGTTTDCPTPSPTTSNPTVTVTPPPTLAPQVPTTSNPTVTSTPLPTFPPGTSFSLETNPSCSSTGG
ncbi:hypothetical protein ACHAXR_000305, partial [Thalassiosira sp. AJA248-18]